jgi:putative tricarboxylic transport membrane protein
MIKKKYQRICNLVWLVTSLTICVASIKLKLGTLTDPGPGFMPFGTGLLLLFFSLAALFREGREEVKEEGPWIGPYWKRVITTIISLSVYALILTRLGYLLSTFLLMIFLFWTPEYKKWMGTIIKAVLSAGITYFVFDKWLDCQLPKGIFGF